uniref:Uncharacterized protein n=1 Tax=Coturnix japonica TaxID=93934 RepID=A0A8C2Y9X3_COTJA
MMNGMEEASWPSPEEKKARGWFHPHSDVGGFVKHWLLASPAALSGGGPSTLKPMSVVNVLLTTPLWVVNTRLKLQGAKFRNEDIVPTNYKGIIDAFHQIIRDEGALALWNGTFPSLLLVFNPAIHFIFYEGFKRKLLKKQTQLTSLDAFVMGAVAKAVATTLTYPLQNFWVTDLEKPGINDCNEKSFLLYARDVSEA